LLFLLADDGESIDAGCPDLPGEEVSPGVCSGGKCSWDTGWSRRIWVVSMLLHLVTFNSQLIHLTVQSAESFWFALNWCIVL